MKVFKNMVLRRIFGPHRDEVTLDCGRLPAEELRRSVFLNKYYSGDQTTKDISRTCGMYGGERCIHGFGGQT